MKQLPANDHGILLCVEMEEREDSDCLDFAWLFADDRIRENESLGDRCCEDSNTENCNSSDAEFKF